MTGDESIFLNMDKTPLVKKGTLVNTKGKCTIKIQTKGT